MGYYNKRSAADEVQIRLNGSTDLNEDWQYRQNIIFGHEIADGAEDGLFAETRFALQRAVGDYDVGIDMLNDFGNLTAVLMSANPESRG